MTRTRFMNDKNNLTMSSTEQCQVSRGEVLLCREVGTCGVSQPTAPVLDRLIGVGAC